MLVVLLAVSACQVLGGEPGGEFPTLRDEIEVTEQSMRDWLDVAFPGHEDIGVAINVGGGCTPTNRDSASIWIFVLPEGDVETAVDWAIESLEAEGVEVEPSTVDTSFRVEYFDLPGSGLRVQMLSASSDSLEPGVAVVRSTGCYEPSRWGVDDLDALRREEGRGIDPRPG
jgi:hypothetical protein